MNSDITKYQGNWQNVFVVMGVRHIGVLFHAFYYYKAEKGGLLYQGIRYIGIHCSRNTKKLYSRQEFGP